MNLPQPKIELTARCNRCNALVTLTEAAAPFAIRHGITCDDCRHGKQWTRETYAAYLQSYHWQTKRTAALKRAGDKCQVCASTNHLEVHHNNYSNLGGEPLTDLVVLCHDCHTLFHGAEL